MGIAMLARALAILLVFSLAANFFFWVEWRYVVAEREFTRELLHQKCIQVSDMG